MSSSKSHGEYKHSRSSVPPPAPLESPTTPTSDPSTGFLKIPRIRLKSQKSQQKSQQSSSPPQQQLQQQNSHNNELSPTDNRKNNKFSYIESSHLVNPAMIREQQQKMVQNKRKEQESGRAEVVVHRSCSDGDEDDDEEFGGTTSSGKVLIKPRKLPNPIKESVAMQSIHRELLLNQKIGRSVLTHKTELQKALEKLATKNVDSDNNDTQDMQAPNPPPMMPLLPNEKKKQVVANNNKNEFQRILDARAKQIEDQKCFVDGLTKSPVIHESEFEKMHKRITATAAATTTSTTGGTHK